MQATFEINAPSVDPEQRLRIAWLRNFRLVIRRKWRPTWVSKKEIRQKQRKEKAGGELRWRSQHSTHG
jgi:hypothetical protein